MVRPKSCDTTDLNVSGKYERIQQSSLSNLEPSKSPMFFSIWLSKSQCTDGRGELEIRIAMESRVFRRRV